MNIATPSVFYTCSNSIASENYSYHIKKTTFWTHLFWFPHKTGPKIPGQYQGINEKHDANRIITKWWTNIMKTWSIDGSATVCSFSLAFIHNQKDFYFWPFQTFHELHKKKYYSKKKNVIKSIDFDSPQNVSGDSKGLDKILLKLQKKHTQQKVAQNIRTGHLHWNRLDFEIIQSQKHWSIDFIGKNEQNNCQIWQ